MTSWSIIPIVIVAAVATFAAIHEGWRFSESRIKSYLNSAERKSNKERTTLQS